MRKFKCTRFPFLCLPSKDVHSYLLLILNWIIYSFAIELRSFYVLGTNLLLDIQTENFSLKIFNSVGCFLILLIVSDAMKNVFTLIKSPMSTFAFVSCAYGIKSIKSLSMPMYWSISCMFSSIVSLFQVLYLGLFFHF